MMIRTSRADDNPALRQAIYQGSIFHFDATAASERLVDDVNALLETELGKSGDVRKAQFNFTDDQFFLEIGRLRKLIFTDKHFHNAAREIMAEFGFSVSENAFEPIRLRVIAHNGHHNPKAAPVYYAHRDTWYAHPQSLISWWIPLHDVEEIETFLFFPDYFQQAVKNGSGEFDYQGWIKDKRELKIGWQDPNAGKDVPYPNLMEALHPKEVISFSAKRGEVILFSGSQLHQTRNNSTGLTRFSLDFRSVHLGDHTQKLGAPNVDNGSSDASLKDYQQP